MKYLLIFTLFLMTGCFSDPVMDDDGFINISGFDYTEDKITYHIKKCVFNRDMFIQCDVDSVNVVAGDTVAIERANRQWFSINDNRSVDFINIDLGTEEYRDTLTESFQHSELVFTDSIKIRVYYADVCSVSVR